MSSSLEEVSEEVELLLSVFGLPGESCQMTDKVPRKVIEVVLAVFNDDSQLCKLVFELDEKYPNSVPNLSMHCLDNDKLKRSDCVRLATQLKERAHALRGTFLIYFFTLRATNNVTFPVPVGSPMLLQICSDAKEILREHIEKAHSASSTLERPEENALSIIELDHIRSWSVYSKNLARWASDNCVDVLVLRLKFRKQKNFWLLIKGNGARVKDFKRDLKTKTVDVDSKGKPCKERMSTEIGFMNLLGQDDEMLFKFRHFSVSEFETESDLRSFCDARNIGHLLPN